MTGWLKSLAPAAEPLALAWVLLLAAATLAARKRQTSPAITFASAFLLLWLLGQPPLVLPLAANLERPWSGASLEQAPHANAVVVLGGGWRSSSLGFPSIDLTAGADRLVTGFELCRQAKATRLVLGGDSVRPLPNTPTASQAVSHWFQSWNLAEIHPISLGPVRTTRDEAQRTRDLVDHHGWTNVLLVTSALHMRRAIATFQNAGVPAHPVACDFRGLRITRESLRWSLFPDADALETFGLWWHEQVGWLAYRASGLL